jgi:hypothetical protein
MKRSLVHEIDLNKIEGDGAFPCPKCGAVVSPDDKTESVYTILKTKFNGDHLEKLIIQCKCGREIHLVGFLLS